MDNKYYEFYAPMPIIESCGSHMGVEEYHTLGYIVAKAYFVGFKYVTEEDSSRGIKVVYTKDKFDLVSDNEIIHDENGVVTNYDLAKSLSPNKEDIVKDVERLNRLKIGNLSRYADYIELTDYLKEKQNILDSSKSINKK